MENWIMYAMLFILFIPVGLTLSFIPFFTRKTESFGISISESIYSIPELKKLRWSYTWINLLLWIVITLTVLVFAGSLTEQQLALSIGITIPLFCSLSFVVYYLHHRKMKELKAIHNWSSPKQVVVIDSNFRSQKLTYSSLWFIPHFLLILVTLGMAVFLYDRFPNEIVMQYDFSGNPTNTIQKTPTNVLWPVAIQFFMLVLFIFINYIIGASKQQLDAAQPEKSKQQNIIFRQHWSRFTIIMGFLTISLFSFSLLSQLFSFSYLIISIFLIFFVAIIMIYTIWLSVKVGQGGSRVRISSNNGTAGVESIDEDRYWKLGVIYFNPKDPATFVEKRFGVGWTVNFARPLAWISLGGIILFTVLIIIFVR
ncbi:DUF1648 domain-containing protein [Bacillus horti]|uniref:Membrane protein n=1 Tax=Caldalkalibacillus horti TaxID=77523 RepID=A0ABT9W191_9BACI|nr:DUF5808 domain-containing protein [Bacillus horti]MDQ0167031.1 putative membrane protein [Bacillus horti]